MITIMPLHNWLVLVSLSKVCLFDIPFSPFSAIFAYIFIIYVIRDFASSLHYVLWVLNFTKHLCFQKLCCLFFFWFYVCILLVYILFKTFSLLKKRRHLIKIRWERNKKSLRYLYWDVILIYRKKKYMSTHYRPRT